MEYFLPVNERRGFAYAPFMELLSRVLALPVKVSVPATYKLCRRIAPT